MVGAVVAVDRQERGTSARTAIEDLIAESGIHVEAIVRITDAAGHLATTPINGRIALDAEGLDRIRSHLAAHG